MRLHSFLLRLYPASFRAEYGAELTHIFSQRRRNATNPISILYVWVTELIDILVNASGVHVDILRQDLRYTVRTLARTPGFTLAAIIVTGLGIGATTAVFSITDHVILRPLPFTNPDQLVQLWQQTPAYSRVELSPPNFQDWRRLSPSFEEMAAYSGFAANFLSNGEPRRLDGTAVTPEFFSILKQKPLFGRTFTTEDARGNAPRTVLMSYALWQSAFGGAADIVGRSVRLDNDSFTVIGIMPADFFFPVRGTQIWTLLNVSAPNNQARDNLYLYAIARLKSGVTIDKARSEMSVIADQLAREYPKENAKTGALVEPLGNQIPSQTRLLLWALFGASLCVLLIACTNLASLLLARALARRKELTVRAAIGAGRERLVRQLLTESMTLALAGGMFGVVVAVVALPLLTVLVPSTLPIGNATVFDARVFSFAAVITLGTGLLFGVLPAMRMCAGTDGIGLREGSRSGIGGTRERLRAVLVVSQITIAVVLLISAGLLIRALWRVQAIDPGFRADSVLAMQTSLPMPRYAPTTTRISFYGEVLSQVRALPGVANAAFISSLPMFQGGGIWPIAIASGDAAEGTAGAQTAAMRFVTPEYFNTMRIPIRSGRDFSDSDTLQTLFVVIVSESFANRYWPNEDAVGRRFHFAMENFPFAQQDRTIVGIVGDVRFRGLERTNEPQVYLAYRQVPDGTTTFYAPKELVVRTSTDTAAMAPTVRSIIKKADPELPISAVRTLRDVVDLQTAPRSTQIRLVASFAALALLLAAVGIHGLLSFTVGQRSAEFGLRIALGAESRSILSMVFREGLVLACIGTALGLILSYYAGRWMQALLAGVAPSDPMTLAVAGALAFTMTLSGSLLPAFRAMRTDPTTVIRGE
jgi:predicted permease